MTYRQQGCKTNLEMQKNYFLISKKYRASDCATISTFLNTQLRRRFLYQKSPFRIYIIYSKKSDLIETIEQKFIAVNLTNQRSACW